MSIMPKESDNTNSLAPIRSPDAPAAANATYLPNINLQNNLSLLDDSCNCLFCLADLIIPYNDQLILYYKKSININGIIDKFVLASPIVYNMRQYDTVVL